MRTAVFIGHSDAFCVSREKLRMVILKSVQVGVTQFMNGGQGYFDCLCATEVHALKKIP